MFAEFSEGKQTFTVDQFHTICERIGEHFTRQEIEAMIQAADTNQDGVIDYQEFLDVVTKEYKKWFIHKEHINIIFEQNCIWNTIKILIFMHAQWYLLNRIYDFVRVIAY